MSLFEPCEAYVITTENGKRTWWADDAQHAREQHEEAFQGEPGEIVLAIEHDPHAEPPGAGADPYGRPDPRLHPEFWTE